MIEFFLLCKTRPEVGNQEIVCLYGHQEPTFPLSFLLCHPWCVASVIRVPHCVRWLLEL